jgi:predicted permease
MTARDLSLIAQIAICAVLVTSSFVAIRGLMRSLHTDLGFRPENGFIMEVGLDMAGYRGDKIPEIQRRILDEIQSIPGVTAAGLIDNPPMSLGPNLAPVFADEQADLKPANAAASSFIFNISTEYLRIAGTVLLAGRSFTSQDDKNSPRVAVVNRQFARKVLKAPDSSALGRHFKLTNGARVEVVGVVEDGKYFNIAEEPRPAMFFPILQSPSPTAWVVLRAAQDPQQLMAALETARRNIDPGLPFRIDTWTKELEPNMFPSRAAAAALGVLGVMAAMLSVTGIFGLAAYSVSKRFKELGIRIALGAKRKEVLQAALGRALKLLAIGSAVGLLLGILASRVLAFIVYQATPRDPIVLTGVVLLMTLVGLLATWIPARRALSIDPLALLREH